MTRLIDADKIPYETGEVSLGNGNYETVKIAYEGDIDAMETVDAIPVEWLEGLHKAAQSDEADRMIDEIISLWEARKNE